MRIRAGQLKSVVVVYEDDQLVVVSKPPGMAVHGGAGEKGRTLIDLMHECYEGKLDVHLAHRIDKETSGLVVLAKSAAIAGTLSKTWESVEKHYYAIALGTVAAKERIALPLSEKDGRKLEAETWVVPRASLDRLEPKATLLQVRIVTGRTHQIRRHLAAIRHPVLMDDKHGDFKANKTWARALKTAGASVKHLCLHSASVVLAHPKTAAKLTLSAPLPPAWDGVLRAAGGPEACIDTHQAAS